MRAIRLLSVVALGSVMIASLAGCAPSAPKAKPFASLSAVQLLPPTSIVDETLKTTMVFTLPPTKSVQTKAGTVPAGECGAAIRTFADAKSKDNAYEEMEDAAQDQIQFNAVRYRSLAVATTAMMAWQTAADVCPHTSGSRISAFPTGIDGVGSWLSNGRHSAAFRVKDTIFYLNTTLSGEDTARVVRAQLSYAQTLVKPG